jgi:hypothetical protein
MELNFLQVILSLQNKFKYKTPREKIHLKLLLESMITIRSLLSSIVSNSRSCDLRSQLNLSSCLKVAKLDEIKQMQIKQTRQLKTFKLEKLKVSN